MSSKFPIAGSVYSYVQRAINPHVGFMSGWLILLDYILVPSLLLVMVANWGTTLVPGSPWWLWVVVFIAFNTFVNVRGITMSKGVDWIIFAVEILALIVFIAVGCMYVSGGGGYGEFSTEPVSYTHLKDHALLKAINTAKEAADLHTNVFAQYVILDYLEHNDLDEHLVKIRNLYRDQARAMTDAMAECFPAEVSFTKPEGGMFLWATLPEGINTMDLFPKALERNVAFVPGEPFSAEPGARSTMRLNFTNADEETIRDGIRRLAEAIAEAL